MLRAKFHWDDFDALLQISLPRIHIINWGGTHYDTLKTSVVGKLFTLIEPPMHENYDEWGEDEAAECYETFYSQYERDEEEETNRRKRKRNKRNKNN